MTPLEFSDGEDEDDPFSDVSSIGSNTDDPNVAFCQVTSPMCRALYRPSTGGQEYICSRSPPCRRHNHAGSDVPRGDAGIYPVDRVSRTGRVRGLLSDKVPDDEVQAIRSREREANRALAAAQAGMLPLGAPARRRGSTRVETVTNDSDDESEEPSASVAEEAPPSPSVNREEEQIDITPHPSPETAARRRSAAAPPPATQDDLTSLIRQLTSAVVGMNTRLEQLEVGTPTPREPSQAPLRVQTTAPTPRNRSRGHSSDAERESAPPRSSILKSRAVPRTTSDEVEIIGTRAAPPTATPLPPPSNWYVVLKGRTPHDIGIYDNWLVVQPMVSGVSHAIFKKFKSEAEAEYYLAGGLNRMNLDLTSNKPAPRASSQPPLDAATISQHPTMDESMSEEYAAFLASRATPPVPDPHGLHQAKRPPTSERGRRGRSEAKQGIGMIREPGVTPAGADPSTGRKGEFYGLQASEDGSVMTACSPPGLTMEGRVRLADQILDAVALPGTSDGGTDETELHRISESLQAIASGRNSANGYPVGQRDSNYKSRKKTSICDIKGVSDLQERLEDLESGADDILKYTEGNLKAVLINEGYDYEGATE
jgi:hypothetical protein